MNRSPPYLRVLSDVLPAHRKYKPEVIRLRNVMKTSFLSKNELRQVGFARYGRNVLISRKVSFYYPEKIEIGNNVRIDDFCILSGHIVMGNYIHIAAYCGLFAGE